VHRDRCGGARRRQLGDRRGHGGSHRGRLPRLRADADTSGGPAEFLGALLRSVWSVEELSIATTRYLHALTDDAGPPESSPSPTTLTPRRIDEDAARPARSSDALAPFFGAELLRWSRECLRSPYGLLYSRIGLPGTNEFAQQSGERLEVSSLGPPPRCPLETSSLSAWMLTRARERGVEVCAVGPLRRLIFDDHEVVGAEFWNDSRRLAVYTRHGVALSTSRRGTEDSALAAWQSSNSQLGLVSVAASRFGRLELLTNREAQSSTSRSRVPHPATSTSTTGRAQAG
jgi:hypothetical protein